MVYSMTPAERENPDLLNPSRRRRIAAGSGNSVVEVNRMIKQFKESRKMMQQMVKRHACWDGSNVWQWYQRQNG